MPALHTASHSVSWKNNIYTYYSLCVNLESSEYLSRFGLLACLAAGNVSSSGGRTTSRAHAEFV